MECQSVGMWEAAPAEDSAVICIAPLIGSSSSLVHPHRREVSPLARRVMLQPVSVPLQDGVRFFPPPYPPDASRYTVPSRFGRQSGDCGYVVRGHLTACYLAAVPRRILLMEQQVWSVVARQSTLRPRVAVPLQEGDASGLGVLPRPPRLHHGRL